jgi:hypothetical protein
MIGRILGLFGAFPQGLAIKAAAIIIACAVSYGLGNHHATQRAMQKQLIEERQASADRQRENHKQLLAWKAETESKLKADFEQERRADQIAHELYQRTIRETQAARNAALAALSKERETNDGLRKVNEILAADVPAPSTGCVMPSSVRNALNAYIASINNHPTVSGSEGIAPGVSLGPDPTDTVLTCSELASSVTDILEHNAMLTAWILSFQAWEVEIAR